MKTAGIIGGSKFIGNYITLKFLAEGFRVKVQVSEKEPQNKDSVFQRICANRNLEISKMELTTPQQIHEFTENCEVLVHCGHPFQLALQSSEIPVFVPIIRNTNILLKSVQNNPSLKKIIFITSVMIFNQGNSPDGKQPPEKNKNHVTKKNIINKARFHAEKAVANILSSFPDNFFEIIYISPVEVRNNLLTNSTESTSSGLQFLFRNKFTPDAFFEKLLKRQSIDRLTNIDELPDKVFFTASQISSASRPETKKGQMLAL
jgi:hypothetical protein